MHFAAALLGRKGSGRWASLDHRGRGIRRRPHVVLRLRSQRRFVVARSQGFPGCNHRLLPTLSLIAQLDRAPVATTSRGGHPNMESSDRFPRVAAIGILAVIAASYVVNAMDRIVFPTL